MRILGPMRILLTNDDGIHAAGLKLLESIAGELSDDVTVVAPENDQSGVAHSLSLSDPLRLREIGPRHFALKGTPTDCVIMGVRKILAGRPPDLVLSGVNRGQNVAEDVTYSGTIAGAMEGALLGIPSIALSQAYGGAVGRPLIEWSAAETHAAPVIRTHPRRRYRSGRPRQCQFSRLPGVRGGGNRAHPPRPTQRRIDAGRGATGRPRLSVLLADVPTGTLRAGGRDGPCGADGQENFDHAAPGSISPTMIPASAVREAFWAKR